MRGAAVLLAGAALAVTSSLALAGGPEDLLPPIFRDPPPQQSAPTPSPTPSPRPTRTESPTPSQSPAAPSSGSGEVVQPIPDTRSSGSGSSFTLPADFPSLAELERMEDDEINEILGLRPQFDIPAAARREVERVGIIARAEGGFPVGSLRNQPAALVGAALQASDGPLVSRWGHILLRRALASRLDAPQGMDPVTFAALRARALVNMGEGAVARALVQDIDGSEYDPALASAAFDAYLATGDILGMCPVARLQSDLSDTGEWELLQAICAAYLGETRSAERRLQRAFGTGVAEEIDVRLAQRYAGAAAESARAVNVEWDGVESLSPWRYALARAVGEDLPENLRAESGPSYDISDVLIPATPLLQRVEIADTAASRGVLSSSAMVDLYSQLWASERYDAADKTLAAGLREAYVANGPAQRLAALQSLWGDEMAYGRLVLTAYAAARFPVGEDYAANAAPLIASMLTAGLDRNALRWSEVVSEGSEAWALLALAEPQGGMVDSGDVDNFVDSSNGGRKAAFLVAGLAGLGRLDQDDFADFAERVNVNYERRSAWSDKIDRAGQVGNATLVALLAGLGMQGSDWSMMTPRHLYHIVRALDAAGLSAEARMIAAEAVARG
ncbi:hypothetical protein [Aurantiacibacter poecillastricola]|uniref:hypothetical protein n=1 Tax=Aurantiacibacter poecillastricola TaxID=3064385 RepID=UPI00273F3DBE|nr:hypothetical protein [Aurantiacibacter sp. 219JJ12-13]MDP5262224.1 hypothetical protein [Aurantiacibacter sp. 219JJ12-13]